MRPSRSGPYYLVIKVGACCDGVVDVVFSRLSIVDDASKEELLTGGDFADGEAWHPFTVAGTVRLEKGGQGASV